MQKSTADTQLDEMIQLYHASEVANGKRPTAGTRRVIYQNIADVPRLLDGSISFSNLRPDAPAFVPKPRIAETPAAEDDAEPETEEPEVDTSKIVDTTASVESITVTELPEDNTTLILSEDRVKAITVFQTLYRKLLRHRRNVANRTALQISCNNFFDECLKESQKIEWPPGSYYRLLFLGPLPHVLVCLHAAHSWTMENKKRNKARFKTATHQDLDEVNKRLTEQK